MTRRWMVLLLALPLLGCPAGPTMGEVADGYAPRLGARLAELRQVIASAPAPGAIVAPPAPVKVEPAPEYRLKAGEFTLDIVQVEHLTDPTFEFYTTPDRLDLHASEVLTIALRETSPGGLSADDRAHASYEQYPRRFERALALRYVAVIRTVEYDRPVAVSETEFSG